MSKRGKKARQRREARHGEPQWPAPPPATPPAPPGSLAQGVRAFLGPHELLVLRCEGHFHYVGGSGGLFLVTVGALPDGPGRIGVTVPEVYPQRDVALDLELVFTPEAGAVLVNGAEVALDAAGRARVAVPPRRPAATRGWTYVLEIERGSGLRGRFDLDCLMLGGGEVIRSTLHPVSPALAAPAPADGAADPFRLPPAFVAHALGGRPEEAYALCSPVYRAAVPLQGFVANLAPVVAASAAPVRDNAVEGRGSGGGAYPFALGYEGFDEVRTTVLEEPKSFLGRLFGGPKPREIVRRGTTGVEGSFALAWLDGRPVILDFHLRRFDDGGPSARRMRAVEAEMGHFRSSTSSL